MGVFGFELQLRLVVDWYLAVKMKGTPLGGEPVQWHARQSPTASKKPKQFDHFTSNLNCKCRCQPQAYVSGQISCSQGGAKRSNSSILYLQIRVYNQPICLWWTWLGLFLRANQKRDWLVIRRRWLMIRQSKRMKSILEWNGRERIEGYIYEWWNDSAKIRENI